MSEEFTNVRSRLDSDRRQVLDNIYNKNLDECKKVDKANIEKDKQHSTIVNMCAFAFSEHGPLTSTGYHFITVEPLYRYRGEKGNKIFDLVIYNKEAMRAILIECKSSIGDARPALLNPLKDQIQNVIKHKRELEEEVGGEIVDTEYVVCGIPQDIEEVSKVLKENEPVCLWSVDLFTFNLKLYNRSGLDSEESGKLVRRRRLHRDEKLRRKLYDKVESRAQIEGIKVMPSSHICRILSRVFVRIIVDVIIDMTEQERRFQYHELVEKVQDELPRLPIDDIRRISEEIHQLAMKMKLIETESTPRNLSSDIPFRLKITARSPRTIDKSIEEKYIEEVCKERSPAESLAEFNQYLKQNIGSLDYHFSKGQA